MNREAERKRLVELLGDYLYSEQIADHLLDNGVVAPPVKVGDWIWYVCQNEVHKAKVREIHYEAANYGKCHYSFWIYAKDLKNKRQIICTPKNETIEVEGVGCKEEISVHLTREEAEKSLKGDAGE